MNILDDIAAALMGNAIAHGYAQSTTATNGVNNQKPVNLEKMAQAIAEFEAKYPCPIAQFMRKHGMPPEQGYLLVVPETLRLDFGPFPPRYVMFHHSVGAPVIVRDMLNFTGPVNVY